MNRHLAEINSDKETSRFYAKYFENPPLWSPVSLACPAIEVKFGIHIKASMLFSSSTAQRLFAVSSHLVRSSSARLRAGLVVEFRKCLRRRRCRTNLAVDHVGRISGVSLHRRHRRLNSSTSPAMVTQPCVFSQPFSYTSLQHTAVNLFDA
ncbi:hypothetical protein ARMSODRAFT_663594 [Armillaria solidipes]|uniref:Uncharacterized protein n=1 Tax=Armillaria solidipes TaxID=1076256 RepID=A0A2H3AUX0_9AGAR|nr:hypothetical protein ARMSODRAFT_663594 [Armillaria solidipes]